MTEMFGRDSDTGGSRSVEGGSGAGGGGGGGGGPAAAAAAGNGGGGGGGDGNGGDGGEAGGGGGQDGHNSRAALLLGMTKPSHVYVTQVSDHCQFAYNYILMVNDREIRYNGAM